MVLSVCNQKGGVGKSTTACALASYYWSKEYPGHKKSLLIELDAQCNLAKTYQVPEDALTIYDALTGKADLLEAIYPSELGDIVPGSPELYLLNEFDIDSLKKAIKSVAKMYDVIIIDTPPILGAVMLSAIRASDDIIIPVLADLYSMQGLDGMIRTIKASNKKAKIDGILVTRYRGNANIRKSVINALEYISSSLKTRVFDSKIRDSVAIDEANANYKSIYKYCQAKTKRNPVEDYVALINEIGLPQ